MFKYFGNNVSSAALLISLIYITASISFSQDKVQLRVSEDSKIWPRKQVDLIRALYADEEGKPSYPTFLKKSGLLPQNLTRKRTPYFSASFALNDIVKTDTGMRPRHKATPLNIDFYIELEKEYHAFNKSSPIWDGRVYEENDMIFVGGYSSAYNERKIARINRDGVFIRIIPDLYTDDFPLLLIPANEILFDPFHLRLLQITPAKEKSITEHTKKYLPLDLYSDKDKPLNESTYYLDYSSGTSTLQLFVRWEDKNILIASCPLLEATISRVTEGYQPQLGDGCQQPLNGKVLKMTFEGKFSSQVNTDNEFIKLAATGNYRMSNLEKSGPIPVNIDGDFQDWRNIKGISDPEGDYISYLYPNPDTDILEFKVSHDDKHLYLYSRLAGAHGRTGLTGRYYWYVYIDLDGNPYTGYPPTRDDNCYFGVALGDDSEAQFEFVGNKFIKTFFGFTGMGTEEEVLNGKLHLGPSHYAPTDPKGNKRDRYKVEYVNRKNSRFITHDYTEGTSEDIIIALSPDASEVEMRVEFAGFLTDPSGIPLMKPGNTIDIAVGAEAASDFYGSNDWGADSTPVLYNYHLD